MNENAVQKYVSNFVYSFDSEKPVNIQVYVEIGGTGKGFVLWRPPWDSSAHCLHAMMEGKI